MGRSRPGHGRGPRPSVRSIVDRYLSSEVVYLGSGFDFGDEQRDDVLQMRRRDWTPWEFERACRNLSHRLSATVKRVETGPGRGPHGGGGRQMKVTGAQALFKSLEGEGVDIVFGIPGGAILPAYDPLLDSSVRHVLCRHEQGAGHAAEGYAWATGKVGVAMATSGPGGCNLVTALADAKMDSVPMVAITGQVPTPVVGNDAFQEADITGITMPVTKHNMLVTDPGRGRRGDPRGVPHRAHGPAGPGPRRPAEGRAGQRDDVEVAGRA